MQPIRMPQGTMSASFSMTELMHIVSDPIPPVSSSEGMSATAGDGSEPSLLHAVDSPLVASTCFYMDDIFLVILPLTQPSAFYRITFFLGSSGLRLDCLLRSLFSLQIKLRRAYSFRRGRG